MKNLTFINSLDKNNLICIVVEPAFLDQRTTM